MNHNLGLELIRIMVIDYNYNEYRLQIYLLKFFKLLSKYINNLFLLKFSMQGFRKYAIDLSKARLAVYFESDILAWDEWGVEGYLSYNINADFYKHANCFWICFKYCGLKEKTVVKNQLKN